MEIECDTGRCSYDVNGGTLVLRFGTNRVRCQTVAGHGRLETTTTGSTQLSFFGCREELTPFRFACVSDGQARSPVQMKTMGTHLRASSHRTPKMLLLAAHASLWCGDDLQFNVEGFWVAYISPFHCNISRRRYTLEPALFAHGQRGTGSIWDVYVRENRDSYQVPDPWVIDFGGQAVLGC